LLAKPTNPLPELLVIENLEIGIRRNRHEVKASVSELRAMEVSEGTARCWAALTLITRAVLL
jgi:hypothetical protein